MTILHVTPSYLPNKGGVETHVASVVKLQQQAGHQVAVLTNPSPHTKAATWRFCLAHLNDFMRADVIQVHDVFWWILPIVPMLWWHHKKIITTFHGWEGQYPVRWQAKLQRFLYNILSTKVVHVGDWIQEFYWDKPDAVIYGGVESPKTVVESMPPHSNLLKIVFIGRLEAENDVKKYLKLVTHLKEILAQSVTVTWVGDGEFRHQCEQVGDVVGMVDQPNKYLRAADLVLAASYLSILEAQSLGKVVVALYSHSLKQRYLETYPGFAAMVMGSDPAKVAKEIDVLLQKGSEYNQYQRLAAQTASQYSWQKVVDIYQQLAR